MNIYEKWGGITLVEFKEGFESNITACLGCETIITFPDLWWGEYCCKGCHNHN